MAIFWWWLLEAVIAFYLYQKAWRYGRYGRDVTLADALRFVFLSLIPVLSLFGAFFFFLDVWSYDGKLKVVLWKKYNDS
jgi:integral membrane sensor domain MASE1